MAEAQPCSFYISEDVGLHFFQVHFFGDRPPYCTARYHRVVDVHGEVNRKKTLLKVGKMRGNYGYHGGTGIFNGGQQREGT